MADGTLPPTNAVEVVTFGCRLNAYESEAIRARAAADGLQDAVVFNTCAVTAEAVRQARQAIRKARREHPDARIVVAGCAAQTDPDSFAEEVARREIRQRIADFRRMVVEEVRRRTAEVRGKEAVARTAVPKQAEQVEFLSAYADQLAQLRRTVHPLARRLASRLAVRRKHAKRGQMDLRRTLRRSMSTGGVPMRPAFKTRRPGRPELVVFCDVSGSVAGFSHFTLLLVQALREQFSKVRVFAFVERADEVTHLFAPGSDLASVMSRVLREAELVTFDGHSDYGGALASMVEHWPDAVGPRSSLLILGDGRTNYRDPNLTVLKRLAGQARHTHFLNPEPRNHWGTGDSAALRYADLVPMHECRTAAQLADVVEALLPV